MSDLLIKFNRSNELANQTYQADLGEVVGDIGLGPLRIGLGGKIVMVDSSVNGVSFKEQYCSTTARVVIVAIAIFTFPVSFPVLALFTGIGCIGLYFSSSHQDILKLYFKNKEESHSEEMATSSK